MDERSKQDFLLRAAVRKLNDEVEKLEFHYMNISGYFASKHMQEAIQEKADCYRKIKGCMRTLFAGLIDF